MKSYSNIARLLYNSNWLILPSVHNSLVSQFVTIAKGSKRKATKGITPLDFNDEDYDEDDADSIDEDGITPIDRQNIDDVDADNDGDNDRDVVYTDPTSVIYVDGIIGKHLSSMETACGGVDLDDVCKQLKLASSDSNCKNIVLYFNTPGGTVTGVPEASALIKEIASSKPIYGYADNLCASAGMWLASQCTAFYVAPSATVGSIGVYNLCLDESLALADDGIKVNAFSAGKYKLSGASFKPMNDEEKAMFQADVDGIYAQFKLAFDGKNVADDDMQGQIFNGLEAVNKNLANGTLNCLDDILSILATTN